MRHPAHRIEDRAEVGLLTAVSRRFQQFGESGLAEFGDGGGGQPPQLLGLLRALRQSLYECVGDTGCDDGHPQNRTIPFSMVRSRPQHEIEKPLTLHHRLFLWRRTGKVQQADACGEGRVGPQFGLASIKPVVAERLSHGPQ